MTKSIVNLIPQVGICGVCGNQTLLTQADANTAIQIGRCCLGAMRTAHFMIEANLPGSGVRHPELGEFATLGN